MKVPHKQILLLWMFSVTPSFGQTDGSVTEPTPPATETKVAQPMGLQNTQTSADPLERRVAEIEERSAKIHTGEAVRAKESTARQTQRRLELDSLREQLDVALSMPPASKARTEQIDQTWSSLRNLVQRLQDDRFQAINALKTAKDDRNQINQDTIAPYKSNPKIQEAMNGFTRAHDARVSAVEQEIDVTSLLLQQTRTLRRSARKDVSSTFLASVDHLRLEEIQAEIISIPLDLRSSVRQTLQAWWKSPDELSQLQAWGALFFGLMELAFLLVAGLWAHSQTPLLTRRLLTYFDPEKNQSSWASNQNFPSWVVAGDIRSLAAPLSSFIQDLLVLSVAVTVISWLQDPLPLVAWIALVFAAGACVRGAQGLIELALITPSENRPGLHVTAPEARKAILWAIQYFGMLKVIQVVVNHLFSVILGADRLSEVFTEAVDIAMALLAVMTLLRWGGLLRSRVQAGGTESGLARWVVASQSSTLKGVIGAIVAVVILTLRFLGNLAQEIIDQRGGLSWLAALLARRQLRDTSETETTYLSSSIRRAIGTEALNRLSMEEYITSIQEKYKAWQHDPRRGLVAVTGDRGSGKNVLMSKLATALDGPTIHAAAPVGHTQRKQALQWLAKLAKVEEPQTSEDLIQSLKKLPPSIFILSNVNRLFLRAVGHYQGLDSVLEVMQATGRHHFWIASFHGPAWTFLHGMNNVGHVNIFSHRIHLGAMSPADLSQWLEAQTRKVGVEPKFDALIHQKQGGADHIRMLERAERAYWRLLTDASQGNPSVAIRLWMDSLRPTNGPEEAFHVSLFTAHDMSELEELRDDELFTLTALILHDDLTVSDLHIALNQPESNVRGLCRGLEQRTIITESETGRYKVRMTWLPAVERHLRRRSFMHKG